MSQRPKLLTGTHFPKAEKSSSSNLVFLDIVLSPKHETMYLPKSLELGRKIQKRNFLPSYSLPTFSLFYVCAPAQAREGEKERESKNKGKQTRSGNVCLRLAGEEGWVPPSFLPTAGRRRNMDGREKGETEEGFSKDIFTQVYLCMQLLGGSGNG